MTHWSAYETANKVRNRATSKVRVHSCTWNVSRAIDFFSASQNQWFSNRNKLGTINKSKSAYGWGSGVFSSIHKQNKIVDLWGADNERARWRLLSHILRISVGFLSDKSINWHRRPQAINKLDRGSIKSCVFGHKIIIKIVKQT